MSEIKYISKINLPNSNETYSIKDEYSRDFIDNNRIAFVVKDKIQQGIEIPTMDDLVNMSSGIIQDPDDEHGGIVTSGGTISDDNTTGGGGGNTSTSPLTAESITQALGYTPADNTTLTALSDNAILKNVTEKQTLSSQLFIGSPTLNVGNAFTHVRKLSDTPDYQGRTVYGLSFAVGYTPEEWAFASIQFKSYDDNGENARNEAVLRFARNRLQIGNRMKLTDRLPAESDYRDIFYDTYTTDKLNTTAKDLIGAINELNDKYVNEQEIKNIIDKDYIMSLIDDGSEVSY